MAPCLAGPEPVVCEDLAGGATSLNKSSEDIISSAACNLPQVRLEHVRELCQKLPKAHQQDKQRIYVNLETAFQHGQMNK